MQKVITSTGNYLQKAGGNRMLDIERLTIPAQAEALRYGHTAVLNHEEILSYMVELTPYLEEGEHFAVVPLGTVAGTVRMYSLRITPVLKVSRDGRI